MADKQQRDVVSEDPSLSDEANAMVTDELRAVVGKERVSVGGPDPGRRREAHASGSTARGALATHRLELTMGSLVVVVTLVLALVAKDSGVLVLLPLLALVVALLYVVRTILHVSSETEHVSPEVAAQLEAEGVTDPDEMFVEMLDDFVDDPGTRGGRAIVTPGDNDREVEAADSPAEAAVEQRSAMTPTSHRSKPSGPNASADEEHGHGS